MTRSSWGCSLQKHQLPDYIQGYDVREISSGTKGRIRTLNIRWLYDTDTNTKKHMEWHLKEQPYKVWDIERHVQKLLLLAWCHIYEESCNLNRLSRQRFWWEWKTKFCKRYWFSIILSKDVFRNNNDIHRKELRFEAMRIADGSVFSEALFNSLRQVIIEDRVTRVFKVDKDVENSYWPVESSRKDLPLPKYIWLFGDGTIRIALFRSRQR